MEYLYDPHGLGIYNIVGPDLADKIVLGAPVQIGGQLVGGLHASLAIAQSLVSDFR